MPGKRLKINSLHQRLCPCRYYCHNHQSPFHNHHRHHHQLSHNLMMMDFGFCAKSNKLVWVNSYMKGHACRGCGKVRERLMNTDPYKLVYYVSNILGLCNQSHGKWQDNYMLLSSLSPSTPVNIYWTTHSQYRKDLMGMYLLVGRFNKIIICFSTC